MTVILLAGRSCAMAWETRDYGERSGLGRPCAGRQAVFSQGRDPGQSFPRVRIDCQWDFKLIFIVVFDIPLWIDSCSADFCVSPLSPNISWKVCYLGQLFVIKKEDWWSHVREAWSKANLIENSCREKMIKSEWSRKQKFTAEEDGRLPTIPTPATHKVQTKYAYGSSFQLDGNDH